MPKVKTWWKARVPKHAKRGPYKTQVRMAA